MYGKRGGIILGLLLALYLAMAYFMDRPLPAGVSTATPWRPVDNPVFLADDTWVDAAGERHFDHAIFDELLRLIGQAERTMVLDQFLFNPFAGTGGVPHRALTEELARALVERARAVPDLQVVFITDPFNTLYGGVSNPSIEKLQAAGIEVVFTDLTKLRDSNPAWSGLWRFCCQWLGNSESGWLPSPVGSEAVTLRSWLALLNFKANHRKTLVADRSDGWAGLVTSANPHSASSAHSNVGLAFEGPAALDLLDTEAAVASFSGHDPKWQPSGARAEAAGLPKMRILTEAAIRDAVLASLENAGEGDRLDLLMFYLSHRPIIEALIDARERGADIRVLLDPNKDAFGRQKSGIPNRPVAAELREAGIPVRWCDTHGEQCHSKMLLHRPASGPARLILGSANFTRRNLDDFNLETNAELRAEPDARVIRDAVGAFERQWHNRDGRHYSVDYETYADESWWKYWFYRFTEATGLSTF